MSFDQRKIVVLGFVVIQGLILALFASNGVFAKSNDGVEGLQPTGLKDALTGSSTLAVSKEHPSNPKDVCAGMHDDPKSVSLMPKTKEEFKTNWYAYPTGWATGDKRGSYRSDSVVYENGTIALKSRYEPGYNFTGTDVLRDFTGSAITTTDKAKFGSHTGDFNSGKFSFCARMPFVGHEKQIGKPLIMLWPDSEHLKNVEVDLLEGFHTSISKGRSEIWVNGANGRGEVYKDRPSTDAPTDDQWHLYQAIWTSNSIEVLIDGKSYIKSTDLRFVPSGTHAPVVQVDLNGLPDDYHKQFSGPATQTSVEVRDMSYSPV